MPWNAHAQDMERNQYGFNTYAARRWVKKDLPLKEWIGAAGTPAIAAQASGRAYSWTMEDTTPDAITTLVDLPNNIDRTQPIRFQILFSMETADKDPDFSIVYTNLAPGDDMTAAATALTTTLPVATDGATGDDSMLRETYVGEIVGRTVESDEEILILTLAIDDDDSTASKTEVWGVRMWYVRQLL